MDLDEIRESIKGAQVESDFGWLEEITFGLLAEVEPMLAVVNAALAWREVPGPIWTDGTDDEIATADAELLTALDAYQPTGPSTGPLPPPWSRAVLP